MDCLESLNRAVAYIESNLDSRIDYEQAAAEACYSVYHIQRLFSFIAGVPMSEYVRRRRMTLAAFDLQNSNAKVIDVALKYGYESPEAFARAFSAVHGISPTAARRQGTAIKAYPRISFQISIKGVSEMNYRIEQKEAFQVYGIEAIFDTKDSKHTKEIPDFWSKLIDSKELERLELSTGLGTLKQLPGGSHAICGHRELSGTTFPYMICTFKTDKSKTDGYKVIDVPAATWAIFSNENEAHTLEETSQATQKLCQRVYTDWLPTASYNLVPGFELEIYLEDDKGKYYEETWVRVTPK